MMGRNVKEDKIRTADGGRLVRKFGVNVAVGILAIGLVGGGYWIVRQQPGSMIQIDRLEETGDEVTETVNENVESDTGESLTKNEEIQLKLLSANTAFHSEGMHNLYTEFKTREKKK